MSSYLTFYIVLKEENSKPISLINYSRNTDVYQYFDEVIHPTFVGMGDEPKYTELTVSKVNEVISELKQDITKATKRVSEYEKQAAGNAELIEEIISQKEWIEDLEYSLRKIEFIRDIVQEASYSWGSYNKVLCNVD